MVLHCMRDLDTSQGKELTLKMVHEASPMAIYPLEKLLWRGRTGHREKRTTEKAEQTPEHDP
jgi:hypothetical protein